MSRRKSSGRPKPFTLDRIRCRVLRGPHREVPERWYWQAVRYEDGEQIHVWAGWATAEEARKALAPILLGLQAAPSKPEHRMETIKDLLETWLAWQLDQPHLGEARKSNSKKETQHLVSVIGDVVIVRTDTTTLEEYQRVRLREGASTGVIRNEISTMIQAWSWGGRMDIAPDRRLRRPRLKHKPRRIDYVPDAVEFWKAVDAVPDVRAWARAMLLLMGATGARPGEIATLTWEDIHWRRRKIRLDGKTGERLASVQQAVLDALEVIKPDPAAGRILPVSVTTARVDIRKILREACEAAAVPRFLPKQIRTMVENAMFDAGADPGVVSQQLGHTPEVSFRHYRKAKARRVEEVMEGAGIGIRPGGNVVSLNEHRRSKDA